MAQLKICGITQPAAVELISSEGVHALGFNFWPHSKRYVSVQQIQSWQLNWPAGLRRVGLFVNASVDEIKAVVSRGFLDSLQLHGDESPEFLASLEPLGLPIVKALTLADAENLPDWLPWQQAGASGLLLDAHAPGIYGGTGRRIDWGRAAQFVRSCPLPVWLAGGLHAENLAQALECVQPAWVDLASGAELAAGVQDAQKVQALARIVQRHGSKNS